MSLQRTPGPSETPAAARPNVALRVIPFIGGFLLLCGLGSLLWVCGEGARGLLYVLVYVAAVAPGLPIGFALFGRRHAAGWIAGGLLGYALSAVACSVAVRLGAHGGLGFLLAWVVLMAVASAVRTVARAPLITLPAWSRRDTAALILVLILVPALMWLPYAHNGAPDATGTRYYRAYFTADFLWHMAVTNELGRLSLPPRDPFFADQTLHYYWMYFTVPAVGASILDSSTHIVEQCLEINAVLSGLLFVSAMFLAVWAAVPRAAAAGISTTLGVLAASVQGWYGICMLYARGRPLIELRETNIGALTAWFLQGLRIDGLPRSLWWTPQHGTACGLGLIALVAATTPPATIPVAGVLLVGVALGASVMFSPLLGGAFAVIYGVTVAVKAIRARAGFVRVVLGHALAAVPVIVALAWCASNQMFEGTTSALAFGFGGLARHAPIETLWLGLGPLLIAALLAMLWPRFPATVLPHAVGVGVGLLLLYEVRIVTDEAWVGFRAGQILQLTLSGLAAVAVARAFDGDRLVRVSGAVLLALLFLAGLPTTMIDVYNAQDTANRLMGPGFRWTIDVTSDEQAAADWIRQATPADAVVQMEPTSRGRDTWSFIPSFAGRRMAAGLAIALIEDARHTRLPELVKAMYETDDGDEAWRIAHDLGIDYVYVDRVEREHFPGCVARFDASGQFLLVYRNAEVVVYAVGR
jgi:hypothetical protein